MENNNIKIVAIDDNKDNLFTLKVLIKEQFPNIDVFTALNGKKGIELAKKENPHLILLDILMPEMDGFEVCEKLKKTKELCDIPVVFVTAFGAKESRIKALNCGVEGFLTKPIDESELTAQINAMLKIRFSTIQKQNEKEHLEELITERTLKLKSELAAHKKTEHELNESEELNRSITQSAPNAIITINDEGLITSWNKASERIFGHTSSEMLGNGLQKIIPTQYSTKHKEGLNRLKNGKKLISKTIEVKALRKDGTEFPIELSLSTWKSATNKTNFTGIIRDISERKKSESVNLQYKYVLSSATDMMAMLDTNFKYQLANDAYCKNLNTTAQELIGSTPIEVFGKKFFEKNILYHATRCMESEVATNYQTWFDFPVLGEKFMDVNYFPYYGNGKKVVGFFVNARDITEQKNIELALVKSKEKIEKSEEKLKQANSQLNLSIENMPTAYILWDLNLKALEWNKAAELIFKFSRDEMIGKNPIDFIVPKEARTIVNEVMKELKSGESTDFTAKNNNIQKDGSYISCQWFNTPLKDDKGIVFGIQTLALDITEQIEARDEIKRKEIFLKEKNNEYKQINAQLLKTQKELLISNSKTEKSEKAYKDVVETTNDLITVVDKNGIFMYVNHASEYFFGMLPNECIGKSAFDFIHPDDRKYTQSKLEEWLNSENTNFYFENRQQSVTGNILFTAWSIYIERKEKEIIKITSIAKDITAQKNTELELVKSKNKAEESNRLKTEFLNNMSHEIRTPMNGILGFSEMLSDPDLSVGKQANFIKIIQSSTNQLLHVIDDILEISKLGTNQVDVVEDNVCINDLLLELFSIFDIRAKENKTPLYLKKTLSDKQSYIYVDKTKLNKVLSNLLENALKFTNQGFVEFGYYLKNQEIELYVKDTGIGIEQANYELIFERFSQAEKDLSKKVGGLGLGLSIAKENTELIGGNIRLESKIKEGSTFFVTIPYKPVYKNDKPNIEGADTQSQSEFTILIAEDEEVNYLYLETLLIDIFSLECKIVHVKNGLEAVEACKENQSIKLVLMDLKMPVLNGYRATEQIREFNRNLPIIAQTAYSTAEEREQALAVGCDVFLIKPIHKKSLKEVIDKYVIKKASI